MTLEAGDENLSVWFRLKVAAWKATNNCPDWIRRADLRPALLHTGLFPFQAQDSAGTREQN